MITNAVQIQEKIIIENRKTVLWFTKTKIVFVNVCILNSKTN